ncbi:12235_t:CDS:2, partial [Racocetra fulgida]
MITWDRIKKLDYDHPLLSFIIELTEPREEFCSLLPSSILSQIIEAPNDYRTDISQEFETIFRNFFEDRRRWVEDDFGIMGPEERQQPFYKKPDFWLLENISQTIQEIVYEETSGDPFKPDQTKFRDDLFKLFRF